MLLTGGWRYARSRPDKAMPLERTYLSIVEKALGEDIKLEEFETLFPDDQSKKTSLMQRSRQDSVGNASLSAAGQQDVCKPYRSLHVGLLMMNL